MWSSDALSQNNPATPRLAISILVEIGFLSLNNQLNSNLLRCLRHKSDARKERLPHRIKNMKRLAVHTKIANGTNRAVAGVS